MLTQTYLRTKFNEGRDFGVYIASGRPNQRDGWARVHSQVAVTESQRALLAAFTRRINVLVTSGLWCGDCAAQVPMLARIESANPAAIHLRILDRDEHDDLSKQIMICGGLRVPTVLFMNEDFDFVGLLGDKTLSYLRAQAALSLGNFCPLPGSVQPADEAAAGMADWIAEFERVHLLLRLSPKLRERHQD